MSRGMELIIGLARLSLEDPRKGARAVLDLGVPLPARTAGLVLMAVLSALFMHLGSPLVPPVEEPIVAFMMASRFRTAVIQWVILAASVLLIHWVGRQRGGTGSLPDALLIVVWLQIMMSAVQLIQLVVLLMAPLLAGIVNMVGLGLFLWLMTNFIAELHGFVSRGAVFVGILITMVAAAFVFVFVLMLLLGPEALINV